MILDCRGFPTVQVEIRCGDVTGQANVPAGRSTGTNEARELRDGGARYHGFDVQVAIGNINNEIGPALIGRDASDQRGLDVFLCELDGTSDKSRLGLPVPMINLVGGGRLTSNDMAFQEFIMMPVGAQSFSEAMRMASETHMALQEIVVARYGKLSANTGDEGDFATPIVDVHEALALVHEGVAAAGYKDDVVYAIDSAAAHLWNVDSRTYTVSGRTYTTEQMIDLYKELVHDFGVVSIEDPLDEEDWEGFTALTAALDGVQIVGDDLFVTNPTRVRKGVSLGAANALLWKVNQIGTLTEAFEAADAAFRGGFGVCVSERSGETEDPIIADLVVALNGGQIKTGSPVRGERTAKYNRLLQIEEWLGTSAVYAGRNFRRPIVGMSAVG
jgi:enolase